VIWLGRLGKNDVVEFLPAMLRLGLIEAQALALQKLNERPKFSQAMGLFQSIPSHIPLPLLGLQHHIWQILSWIFLIVCILSEHPSLPCHSGNPSSQNQAGLILPLACDNR
jgi:hypothetical protein